MPAQEDAAEEQRRTPRTNKTRRAQKKSGARAEDTRRTSNAKIVGE